MGEKVRNGRFSVKNDDEIVLFLVGIRINKIRAVRQWLPMITAMKPMLREASADKDSGLLGYRIQFHGLREMVVIQYWRSTEELMRFAHGETHRRVWKEFYRVATAGAAAGLWHETYVVPPGRYEAIYGMVPPLGLATVRELVPVGRRNDSAATRLGETGPKDRRQ
ncbi:DUF4188 domain-containing protein [Streptosporangium sp. NPDC001559]|uniref:DUF4188 domain-containing protein n=1 Tax=Streptosporangium sp. NPDC001559 TaxID=3366187 RepID=UPI0036F10E65